MTLDTIPSRQTGSAASWTTVIRIYPASVSALIVSGDIPESANLGTKNCLIKNLNC